LARADIAALLSWTDEHFGASARERYETLLSVAFRDVIEDPARAGSLARPNWESFSRATICATAECALGSSARLSAGHATFSSIE
jgi:plasmid stabilization system protein ParE